MKKKSFHTAASHQCRNRLAFLLGLTFLLTIYDIAEGKVVTVPQNRSAGQNMLSQDMLAESGVIYEIRYRYDLGGRTIKIPEGCTLFMNGGTISNGTLILNETDITGVPQSLAVTVGGTQRQLDLSYFVLKDRSILQSIVNTAHIIRLSGEYVDIFDNISVDSELFIIGNGATIRNTGGIATAISVTSNKLFQIKDVTFEVTDGCAIHKKARTNETATRLSFLAENCTFRCKSSNNTRYDLVHLERSRESTISNCRFLETDTLCMFTGIRTDCAVNPSVTVCQFSNLDYGIRAVGASGDDALFCCGLNVQSVTMLGCDYGIRISNYASFFLNNSMIDFCHMPLLLESQDGANITNNYFSTKRYLKRGDFNSSVAFRIYDKNSNCNRHILFTGNTVYGHRQTDNYGLEMDVYGKDCIIADNLFEHFTGYAIHFVNSGSNNPIENTNIRGNRFKFSEGLDITAAIGSDTYPGSGNIYISENYLYDPDSSINSNKLVKGTEDYVHGYYNFRSNHIYQPTTSQSGTVVSSIIQARKKDSTHIRLSLKFERGSDTLTIPNPMCDSHTLVTICNNSIPVNVTRIGNNTIQFETKRSGNNSGEITFLADITYLNTF